MLFKIGQHIRQERIKRRMSQEKLASLLGMSRATISQIETGTVREIGCRKLIRILDVFDLELAVRPAGAPPTLEELQREQEKL
jgi:transcriptional regulator with XRE-family HTH domain